MSNYVSKRAEEYNDTLCEAIDTLISARLSELRFDKTIVCTITDISKRASGEYTVTDGTVTFQALSDSSDYTDGSQVQVLIPNGDWTAQKRIIGRYSSDTENDPIIHVAPTAQVVQLSENYAPKIEEAQPIELVANFNGQWTSDSIPQYSSEHLFSKSELNLNTEIYNTLCVKGKFKTAFDNYSMQKGIYGLIITLEAVDNEGVITTLNFDMSSHSDMFGNIYGFSDWVSQEQAYMINSSVGVIKSIDAKFYQNGEFIALDDDGKASVIVGAEVKPEPGNEAANLFLSDLEVYFGANMATVADNTAKIYTNDALNYVPGEGTNLQKAVELIWYNKTDGNLFIEFNDGEFNKDYAVSIKYTEEEAGEKNKEIEAKYREDNKIGATEDLTDEQKAALEKLKVSTKDEVYPIPENDKNNYYWIQWYADDATGATQLIAEGPKTSSILTKEEDIKKAMSLKIDCIPSLLETDVYAIVWLNKAKYKSNTITFTNQTSKAGLVQEKDVTISIQNTDKASDTYAIYGEDNLAIGVEASTKRNVELDWSWTKGIIEPDFWNGATVSWSLPAQNTMLQHLHGKKDADYGGDIKNTDVYKTKEDGTTIQTDDDGNKILKEEKADQFKFAYRLSDYYNPLYTNNTITCTVVKGDGEDRIELTATKHITLSSQGTFGTDYTLVVSPTDDRPYGFSFSTEGESSAKLEDFKAVLVDINNKEIEGAEITLSGPKAEIQTFQPDAYNVITASTSVKWAEERQVKLQTIYPVIYSAENKYHASVPIKIIYDSFGSLTQTMKNITPLELFDESEKKVENVEWQIVYSFAAPEEDDSQKIKDMYSRKLSQMPQIQGNSIVAPTIFYADNNDTAYLKATLDGKVVWTSPLIMTQYKYGSTVLNDWNGQTIVDTENNRILTNAFAAGKMNTDNTFSGVVLGEVENITDTGKIGKTGLYGYSSGAQAYAFRDDGTAFIGKSGAGRIEFSGDKGTITSENWLTNQQGIHMDLKEGHLNIQNENNYFKFDGNGLDIKADNLSLTSNTLGGKNLLRYTNSKLPESNVGYAWEGWISEDVQPAGVTQPIGVEQNGIEAKITIITEQTVNNDKHFVLYRMSNTDAEALALNQSYAISFDIYPEQVSGTDYKCDITYSFNPGDEGRAGRYSEQHLSKKELPLGQWAHIAGIIMRTAYEIQEGHPGGLKFSFGTLPANSELKFSIKNMKIEEGTIATPWTPYDDEILTQTNLNIDTDNIVATVTDKIGNDYVPNSGGGSTFGWKLDANGFYFANSENPSSSNYVMKIDPVGAEIKGTINATGGTIAGINIDSNGISCSEGEPEKEQPPVEDLKPGGVGPGTGFGLWKTRDAEGNFQHPQNGSTIIFHAGHNNRHIGTAPFRILADGTVYANKLYAQSGGNIAGFEIKGDTLISELLKLSPAAEDDIIFTAGKTKSGTTKTTTITGRVESGKIREINNGYPWHWSITVEGRVTKQDSVMPPDSLNCDYDAKTHKTTCTFKGYTEEPAQKVLCSAILTIESTRELLGFRIASDNQVFIEGFDKSLQQILLDLGVSQ